MKILKSLFSRYVYAVKDVFIYPSKPFFNSNKPPTKLTSSICKLWMPL